MRAFVALPLPEDLCDELEELASALPFGRDVLAENMHVTLAFLGEQTPDALESLHERLKGLTAVAPHLKVDRLDVFGGGKPRVLFANIVPDDALTALSRKVRQAARSSGITLGHERFRPHITIRRFHRQTEPQMDALHRFLTGERAFSWPAFTVPEMQLVGSTLMPHGPEYEVLAAYPLTP